MAGAWDDDAADIYAKLAADELTDDALRLAYAGFLLEGEKFVEDLRVAQAVALFDGALGFPLLSAFLRSGATNVQVMAAGVDGAFGLCLLAQCNRPGMYVLT